MELPLPQRVVSPQAYRSACNFLPPKLALGPSRLKGFSRLPPPEAAQARSRSGNQRFSITVLMYEETAVPSALSHSNRSRVGRGSKV